MTAVLPIEDTSRRLLDSAATLSYDPDAEIDWDAPLDPSLYGLNPEWSTLHGTALWDRMTEQQRVTLTRHEVASIMSTGIWFEMILQQMILRHEYRKDHASNEFRFALTEIGDECRHSAMFARTCQALGATGYFPSRPAVELGRVYKTVAHGELAYAAILVAEEVLDVMQRDWMRGENVLPMVRTTSKIHVVEESRHMKYARAEIRDLLEGAGRARRLAGGVVIAVAAKIIVDNMVSPEVYAAAGLDRAEAVAAARANPHRAVMLRSSCTHLMAFLGEVGLLTPAAVRVYRAAHMI
ncbi:AurF N-oxygenase family protein [Jatrophihabitans sp. YIM 134969]